MGEHADDCLDMVLNDRDPHVVNLHNDNFYEEDRMPPKKKATTRKKPTPKRRTKPSTQRLPLTIVPYGPSGCGKTSWAAHFPRCGFICDNQEKGIIYLSKGNLVPQPVWIDYSFDVESDRSWEQLVQRVYDAATDDSIDTLVIETVTGLQAMCYNYHCAMEFGGDTSKNGFYSYYQGPKNAAQFEWPKLIAAMDTVSENGKHVIISAHAQAKEEPDPDGTVVMKWKAHAEDALWQRLHRWASCVFFIGQRVEEERRKKTIRKIAAPDFDRLLYTEATPFCVAKNWLGIEGIIHLGDKPKEGYDNFVAALSERNLVL